MKTQPSLRIIVFISGTGSNLKAIIEHCDRKVQATILAVVSNNPSAAGLDHAVEAYIPVHVLDHKTFDNRRAHERAIEEVVDNYAPDLLVLAGYMRIFSEEFTKKYQQRMVNIHPSLLPKYKGTDTHARVLADYRAGRETSHGCSVHWVTAGVDEGKVIAQMAFEIDEEDTEASLQEKVHLLEHQLYPQVLHLLATTGLRAHLSGEK